MAVHIGSTFGYLKLDSWVLAKIIQLATYDFCRRHLNRSNDPCGRQFDQTTQASRAVPANIAEGLSRHDTSIETEMRLLDVARASLSEVIDDYLFFLMDRKIPVWGNENPNYDALRNIRLDYVSFGVNMLKEANENVLKQKSKFDPWIENSDPGISANSIIILCLRVSKILRKQLETLLEKFEKEGGFTENMTQSRLEAKKNASITEGAPVCKRCGAPMILKMARKGVNAGRQFWSCSNFHKTGCNYTLEYNDGR